MLHFPVGRRTAGRQFQRFSHGAGFAGGRLQYRSARARPVVAQLGKAGQFSAVENSIRLGTTAGLPWRLLAGGGNAGFTAGIKSALSAALIYNPAAVLQALNKGNDLPLNDICTAPPEVQGDTAITSFRERAARALSTVRVGDLSAPRDACIAALKG